MKFQIKKVSGDDCSDVRGATMKTGVREVRWPDNAHHWQALQERGIGEDSVEIKDGRLHATIPEDSWEIEIDSLDDLVELQKSVTCPLIINGNVLEIYDDYRE